MHDEHGTNLLLYCRGIFVAFFVDYDSEMIRETCMCVYTCSCMQTHMRAHAHTEKVKKMLPKVLL